MARWSMSSGKTITAGRGADVRFLRVAFGGGVVADSSDLVVEAVLEVAVELVVDLRRALGSEVPPGAKEPSSSFALRIRRA